MRTIALASQSVVEVISAYSAPAAQFDAVATEPAWFVAGAFTLSASAEARLEAIGMVSEDGVTLRLRLFDMEEGEPVLGTTVEITETASTSRRSSKVSLSGSRQYQIQVEAIGESGFGVLQTATLV